MSEFRKIAWFKQEHEILTDPEDVLKLPCVANYLEVIENGTQPVSDEVEQLVNNVLPKALDMMREGTIYFDKTAVYQMIAVPATAFPYGLYDWEAFLTIFIAGFRFSDDDTLCYDESPSCVFIPDCISAVRDLSEPSPV